MTIAFGENGVPMLGTDMLPSKLKLNFCGRVSRVPKEGSIFLTRAFEQNFYMETGAHATPGNSELLFPAWLVQEETDDAKANLSIDKRTTVFKFSYHSGSQMTSIECNVEVYQLSPNPFSIGKPWAPLVRKPMPAMMSKARVRSETNEAAEREKQATTRIHGVAKPKASKLGKGKNGQTGKIDKEEAAALSLVRHLLR